mmetsp:Transcript_28217/g.70022  ORF Transcript_28217/g.70022 Transcript_28217/m.70022 type:complete len:205 (-) Transcript_28217:492-1106(-)
MLSIGDSHEHSSSCRKLTRHFQNHRVYVPKPSSARRRRPKLTIPRRGGDERRAFPSHDGHGCRVVFNEPVELAICSEDHHFLFGRLDWFHDVLLVLVVIFRLLLRDVRVVVHELHLLLIRIDSNRRCRTLACPALQQPEVHRLGHDHKVGRQAHRLEVRLPVSLVRREPPAPVEVRHIQSLDRLPDPRPLLAERQFGADLSKEA